MGWGGVVWGGVGRPEHHLTSWSGTTPPAAVECAPSGGALGDSTQSSFAVLPSAAPPGGHNIIIKLYSQFSTCSEYFM